MTAAAISSWSEGPSHPLTTPSSAPCPEPLHAEPAWRVGKVYGTRSLSRLTPPGTTTRASERAAARETCEKSVASGQTPASHTTLVICTEAKQRGCWRRICARRRGSAAARSARPRSGARGAGGLRQLSPPWVVSRATKQPHGVRAGGRIRSTRGLNQGCALCSCRWLHCWREVGGGGGGAHWLRQLSRR